MIDFHHEFLFRSPVVWIVDTRWRPHDHLLTREFDSPMPEITFMRSGMFVRRHGRLGTACDPNTLLFLNVDEPYRMTHPVEVDCACTALHVDAAVLRDLLAEHDPAAADRGARAFTFDSGPCAAQTTVGHFALLRRALDPASQDPLEIEEASLALARAAVATAYGFHGQRRRRRRPGTEKAHTQVAEATKAILARRYRERLSLVDVARAVHVAPNHLCTVFRERTGFTIHAYVTRLRLAAAVDLLAERRRPLADLALALGFSHHSHFTTAFRRAYGKPPSRLLRALVQPEAGKDARRPRPRDGAPPKT